MFIYGLLLICIVLSVICYKILLNYHVKLHFKKAFAELADICEREGNYDEAIKYYLKMIDDKDYDKLNELGIMYNYQKDYEKAIKYYMMGIEINNDPYCMNNLANIYYDQEKFEEAKKYYEMANKCEHYDNIGDLADTYEKLGSVDDVSKETESLCSKEIYYLIFIENMLSKEEYDVNKCIYGITNLANMYYNQNRFGRAEKYYKMAIEINGKNNETKNKNIEALNNLVGVYCEQSKWKEAKTYALISFKNNFAEGAYNMGLFYHSQHNRKAMIYCKIAIKNKDIMSEDAFLRHNMPAQAMNLLGYIYHHDDLNYEKAEKYFKMAIDHYNDFIIAINNLGNVYFCQCLWYDAEKYYLKATDKGNYDEIYNLVHIYNNLQKRDKMEKYCIIGVEHGNKECVKTLVNMYIHEEKYDSILYGYNKYYKKDDIDINKYITEIFELKININDESKHILKAFEYECNFDSDLVYSEDNLVTLNDIQIITSNKLKIFKITNEIPMLEIYENDRFTTFEMLRNHVLLYKNYTRMPKYIIIEIIKWLFK